MAIHKQIAGECHHCLWKIYGHPIHLIMITLIPERKSAFERQLILLLPYKQTDPSINGLVIHSITFNRDPACEGNLFITSPVFPAALGLFNAPCHTVLQVSAISVHRHTNTLLKSQSVKPLKASFVQTIVQTCRR